MTYCEKRPGFVKNFFQVDKRFSGSKLEASVNFYCKKETFKGIYLFIQHFFLSRSFSSPEEHW